MARSIGKAARLGEPALLALADGTVFEGRAFGRPLAPDSPAVGEVVFNTSMFGYQEIMTDPSYAAQILTFTCPHIGNVGCNREDYESDRIHASGAIIRDVSPIVSNFRSEMSFSEWLERDGVMGLYGIDTRALVSYLRDKGSQVGAMAVGSASDAATLVDHARAFGSMEGKNLVHEVSCARAYSWSELPWELPSQTCASQSSYRRLAEEALAGRPHVVAIDCGIKRNILRLLVASGFRVSVVPSVSSATEIFAMKPDALFLSNGPGDPATLGSLVKAIRDCAGKIPIFGICLGHQILGQVYGGKTFKLKFGHRGGNHPVKDMRSGKVEITVQNHGFAVDAASLPRSVSVTHINLNDKTVEGIEVAEDKAFSVQYHPEASPGPHDSQYLFNRFFELVVKV